MVKTPGCILLFGIFLGVNGESTFAGSSVTSDSSGTRSVLVTGQNGAGGVISSRFGGGNSGVAVGSGSRGGPVGAFAGPAGAYAGAGGAFANAGGAYAGAGSFGGFPYWNGGSSGAYAGGSPSYNYPYDPYNGYGGGYNSGGYGNGVGVYSSSDSNGIQTRFANVGPGGRATIVEQNGDEPARVYTYRGANKDSDEYDN
ncbi:hypothetical protein Ocin01_10692 [Orchesella cincta]|uniref:Uncharacterized protein n=1 Tax=Orchesella cincta TaxID=48709 RepID=A0A1D2MS95_ORCCI|nr:hypothetical protein Ocin01_10692 [Orchesella cincta]